MTGIAGHITFDQVDSDLEVNFGGEYTDFEFEVGGELDTPSASDERLTSRGAYLGGNQGCVVDCSKGSNHRVVSRNDRVVEVQKYISSSWVTVLEVAFIAPTSIGARFNVITANEDLPVFVKARP